MKNRLKQILLVLGSICFTLIVLELICQYVDPKYYKFNHKSQEYYSNPRNYYDFLGYDLDGDAKYGLHYRVDPHTEYRLPDNT